MTRRGVIYMAWKKNAIEQAKQSIGSLQRFGRELSIVVVGDQMTCDAFAEMAGVSTVLCPVDPFDHTLKKGYQFLAGRIKPLLDEISPFEKTLYVDADTYFQRSPVEGFDLLDRWDVAIAETETRAIADGIAGPEECAETAKEFGTGLLLYHNSGMIFWRKNERTERLFELWSDEWQRYQGWDEQVAFLRALLRSEALWLTLPHTWNHSGVSDCYLLSHWYGGGDARHDMRQRQRELRTSRKKNHPSPLIKIEIAPGQWVQCKPEEEARIRELYGLDINDELIKELKMMRNDNPLVKVPRGRAGQYVKMRKKDAERLGLPWEWEDAAMAPDGDKMLTGFERKAPGEQEKQGEVPQTAEETAEGTAKEVVDFSVIKGVGEATSEALHAQGIHSFQQLFDAEDLSFLAAQARKAIMKWRRS